MTTKMAEKAQIIQEYKVHDTDCGSTDVQIAVLTERIRGLTKHLQLHKKDTHTRNGLLKLVGRRNRLLRYLQRIDLPHYEKLVKKLGIRGVRTNV